MNALRLPFALMALTALPLEPTLAEVSGVVVVRHAEKAEDGAPDPGLTEAGHQRAAALADALEHARVGGLIASHYRRTQQTLAVLAARHDLEVATVPVDSDRIETHVQAVVSQAEAYQAEGLLVIVGHANTVPLIVEALSGEIIAPIDESEYDRMFLMLPGESGMDLITTRYGPAGAVPAESSSD